MTADQRIARQPENCTAGAEINLDEDPSGKPYLTRGTCPVMNIAVMYGFGDCKRYACPHNASHELADIDAPL